MNFKKTLAALVAASAILFTPALAEESNRLTPVIDSTVVLSSNGEGVCSTQFILPTLAVTANHCVTNPKGEYSVAVHKVIDNVIVSTQVYPVTVEKRFPKTDLAFLKLKDPAAEFPVVGLATRTDLKGIEVGTPVLSFGYPGTMFRKQGLLFITDGRFLGFREDFIPDTDGLFISTTAPIGPGMSGGGVYIEKDGRLLLIGVTTQRDPTAEAPESVFVPASEVREALSKLDTKDDPELDPLLKDLVDKLNDKIAAASE